MAIRQWKPKPLAITPEDTIEQRRGGRYVCTTAWGSIEKADKGLHNPVRPRNAHPLHDGQLSRVGWWREQVVGHVGVLRMQVRLGSARLAFAGIAGVCADPRARNRGIASDLMKDSLVASRQAGLSFSVLFGIHNFYHRFGFVPAWAKHTITAKVGDLPGTPHWRARKAGKADVPKMFEHYERLYGAMDGSAVREPRLFLRRKKDAVFILQGPHKADWAYAVFRTPMGDGGGLLHLLEASGNGADWPEAVLHQAARHAGKVQQEEVTFALPAAHPVCWQMTFRNATAKIEYARNGAAMAAVLDFAGLARAMAPEWCRLASTAGTPVPREGLAIRLRDEYYRWWPNRADGRTEQMSAMPRKIDVEFNDALARLVMGYGEPDEILHHYGMRVKEIALPIVRAIFPARQCAFSPVDYF